eukprot:9296101-Alexandrium_andersonii.AAC.1
MRRLRCPVLHYWVVSDFRRIQVSGRVTSSIDGAGIAASSGWLRGQLANCGQRARRVCSDSPMKLVRAVFGTMCSITPFA